MKARKTRPLAVVAAPVPAPTNEEALAMRFANTVSNLEYQIRCGNDAARKIAASITEADENAENEAFNALEYQLNWAETKMVEAAKARIAYAVLQDMRYHTDGAPEGQRVDRYEALSRALLNQIKACERQLLGNYCNGTSSGAGFARAVENCKREALSAMHREMVSSQEYLQNAIDRVANAPLEA